MPDAAPPSPNRKPVSSVSAAARQQKKAGAPKPKGAVRAKSGCYTCRIRRKKCDEQPNDQGACQTCVRLRLQCLGFGAKRPDWMRENNSVTELREKIKTFLASQGMIKGHSGSGPRTNDQEPQMLILVENLRNASPSSPPTPTLSASSSDGHRPVGGLATSFVRDGSHYQPAPPPMQHEPSYSASWQPTLPDLGGHHHDSALARSNNVLPNVNDMLYPPPASMLPSSNSLVPISSSSSWLVHNGPTTPVTPVSAYPNPMSAVSTTYLGPGAGMPSSFGPGYNLNVTYNDNEDEQVVQPPDPPIPPSIHSDYQIIPPDQTELVQHYFHSVLPIQYLLADASISNFMFRLIQRSPSARDAACVLSALHMHSIQYPSRSRTPDMAVIYRRLESALAAKRTYNEGDAMAGLHVVSTFLFSGGRGPWGAYLDIAGQYVDMVLADRRFYGPEDVLKKCSDSTRFIIKTTMWFDVLASVTTLQVPRFLETYRHLFGRGAGIIGGGGGGGAAYIDDGIATAPELSMLPVMGCENHIVLAIAEISNLAHWAESQRHRGCLSVPQLVERGLEIENKYLHPTATAYGRFDPTQTTSDPEVARRRRLTNDIFRASARVYLHTVLSGDYPSCPEIIAGVAETIECLRRVPTQNASASRSVLRSVVFSICICGCLTDDPRHRTFLLQLLESQQGDNVGNVSEVRSLMEQVWERREGNQGRPVNWRDVMRESQRDLLLLV
ncbi:hypothetical protein DAEQUDRAFT_728501 [Daedalea quercina L-15889]|uniref:Zn(2)-C6 fungal-type domain-containing protein n=1 Tax=Daedalea quercina L-15889 TaxID=1314783 RepID=A0A165PAN9_9APHY|nr:hypothetical protein DAEQUDRAFT_728501 [Daedalea quercina L-15889]